MAVNLHTNIKPTLNERVARRNFPKFNYYFKLKQFLTRVEVGEEDECWIWQGSRTGKCYGTFTWPEKHIVNAHVAAYVLFVGHRHGLQVCHSCDNKLCINPKHLWLGTQTQNIEDMYKKGR